MIRHDTLFTNVALTANNEPWWEGPRGRAGHRLAGPAVRSENGPAAHPNSRFTVAATQNPAYGKAAEDPRGVPISALIFGGRRRELAPLVYEARDWQHGVLVGASVASETTAAATGQVGVVRRDPMAMKPFCRLQLRRLLGALAPDGRAAEAPAAHLPRQLVPSGCRRQVPLAGLGENLRVLAWMLERCARRARARRDADRLHAPSLRI